MSCSTPLLTVTGRLIRGAGLCLGWAFTAATAGASEPATAEIEFFERRVRPLLVEHCYECHSDQSAKLQAGLLLDSRPSMLAGGDSGAAIVPGNPDGSLLMQAVRYEGYEMPPRGKLPQADIDVLAEWIERGAVWPEQPPSQSAHRQPQFDLQARARSHWAWQAIQAVSLPEVADTAWPENAIDRFVLANLEASQLRPAPDAERLVLLRRLYFDLIGLPPSPEEVIRFAQDEGADAVARVVDQLLQSPQFGERWGRHWLDLVRYAESRGHEFDDDAENAFQYRDYVIRALNADVAYDQFVREHIAGDLLATPRRDPATGFNESILGTGFWFLGEWVHSPVDIRKDESDRFDNMIDVMSKTFLGLTVACARCHDHKFDAISTADYYALSGFLQGSDFRQVRFDSLEHNRHIASRLSQVDARFRRQVEQLLASHTPEAAAAPFATDSTIGVATSGADKPLSPPPACDWGAQLGNHLLVDYASIAPEDYLQDGFIFGSQPSRAGDWLLAGSGQKPELGCSLSTAATSDPFWHGLRSLSQPDARSRSALSKLPRSGRTLRTPTFELKEGQVACRVQGSGHVVACVDSHRLVAGPLHGETVKAIAADQPWVQLDLQRYVGHRLHLEFTPAEEQTLSVACVLQGATQDMRQVVDEHLARQQAQAQARLAQVQQRLLQSPALAAAMSDLLQAWAGQRAALQSQVKTDSRLAMAMLDGSGEDDRILIRGSSSNPGRVEPRHFLTALEGDQPLEISRGSGRLELAHRINDPANPLTARVIVNRLWHHLLGRGIVPTTDDFGVLGQPPTNLALLDYLATDFVRHGQSLKHTLRNIVLSRTYRMSGHLQPQARQVDPSNVAWHYRPPKRLEGEVIRDALLAVAGRLDYTHGGPPIPIHLTPFMDGRGRPPASGPLDGDGRRTIYIAVRRNFLSPFMLAFDTPSPFSSMGRRTSSNVPAQALILMNDPFVNMQVEHWAERRRQPAAGGQPAPSPSAQVEWFYLSGLGRWPTATETQLAEAFVERRLSQGVSPVDTWRDVAHALVNTKEFIFLR